jgi:hypothetical protein
MKHAGLAGGLAWPRKWLWLPRPRPELGASSYNPVPSRAEVLGPRQLRVN